MERKMLQELMEDTTIDDIADRYRDIVEIVGVTKFIQLSDYARGHELYFPKAENILAPARNRRIKKEYDGYNEKELADRYNLTIQQIRNIMKDEPPVGQMSFEDYFPSGTGRLT